MKLCVVWQSFEKIGSNSSEKFGCEKRVNSNGRSLFDSITNMCNIKITDNCEIDTLTLDESRVANFRHLLSGTQNDDKGSYANLTNHECNTEFTTIIVMLPTKFPNVYAMSIRRHRLTMVVGCNDDWPHAIFCLFLSPRDCAFQSCPCEDILEPTMVQHNHVTGALSTVS